MAQVPSNVQQRFKANVEYIVATLHNRIVANKSKYPNLPDPKLTDGIIIGIGAYDAEKLIQSFIRHSFKYWPEIKKRNKDFFIGSADKIFGGFGFGDRVESFKILFTTPNLIEEDTLVKFYDKFQEMVRQCLAYILEKLGTGKSITFGEVKLTKEQAMELKMEWESTKPKK